MKFTLSWNITTYEATATGGHLGKKKKKKIMRGAESSKWFMSYEIYFELEYYYLRSNCNGRSLGGKNHGTLVPEPCIFIGLLLRS